MNKLKLLGGMMVLVASASHLMMARGAQTDLSSTPITNSAAAQAKPNIMLLMDTSGSMGWSHMPDEVESVTGIGSIGYKSSQCNALYYNPNTVYGLPRKADGTFFPTPSFTAAYYNVYKDLYTTPAASPTLVNLSTSFKAYDDETLRLNLLGDPYSPFNDTPQPAYYYVYTGTQTLSYASAPCTDPDVGATVGATGGGTWTRVVVGASERQNFANWYTYYRTRMALTKSAISLAFTPLTDSFRVGFITVYPKTSPSAASIDTSKYLAISDFNTTQRGLWFDKVFSQVPDGSSPAREGLARVGRHYAGKTDGINTGMTGDPVQYSCQQNFTIMTTDGYWNDQQESPGGGPVQLDGVTRVGQQDGTLTDNSGLTPRPIWEGQGDIQHTVRNKMRQFSYAGCTGPYFNVSTLQNLRSTHQILKSTTQTLQQTSQMTQSTVQYLQSTQQMLKSTSQTRQLTSQVKRSVLRYLQSTTQKLKSTTQVLQTTSQVYKSTVQNRLCPNASELCEPVVTCTETADHHCEVVTTGPTLVASCTNEPASAGNIYTATTCTTNTNANVPVASCTNSGPTAPSYITTTCTTNTTTNVPVASCTNAAATAPSYIAVTCTSNDTTNVPVASCTPSGPTAPNYITTTCPAPIVVSAATPVASCTPSPGVAPNYDSTVCTPINTNTPVLSCTASGPTAPSYITTTCTTNTTTNVPVASCTPSSPTAPSYITTTCTPNNTSNVPSPTCINAGPTAPSYVTYSCTTNVLSGPTPVASCTPSTGPAPSYTTVVCNPVNTSTPVASCTPSGPTAPNYITTNCTPNNTSNVPVASCTNSGPTAPNYITTTCSNNDTSNVPVASCTPSGPSAPNYITTTCPAPVVTSSPTPVPSCTPVTPTAPNYIATTCTPLAGQKIQYSDTLTTTQTPYSGSTPAGPPVSSNVSTPAADVDGVCYVAGAGPALPDLPAPNPQPAPGDGTCAAWPCSADTPLSGGSISSLADVAQYYYVTDLRPSMPNNVPAVGSGPEDDRAAWQHMTTFSIALGVSGTLNYRPDYRTAATGDFADIRNPSTSKPWPVWPDPTMTSWDAGSATYTNKTMWNNPRSIDDFWHAAVNGRGQFFSARNPNDVVNGIAGALAGIQARLGGAAAGTSTQAPVSGNNFAFTANYTSSQWTGDVEARTIDLSTGLIGTATSWSAQTLLDTRVGAACDTRTIHLMRQGATNNLTPFTWNTQTCDSLNLPTGAASTGLNSAEQAKFNAAVAAQLSQYPSMTDGTASTADQRTPAAGANLVNFLRGQRGLEGFVANDASKLYRTRTHILGDIVGGQPIYVKAPFARYQDSGYLTFKTDNANRTPMVYVPANDGMLHAFYAETNTSTGTQGGKEAWAVIPSAVLPNLYKLADNNYGNLHQYSVDGVPAIGDAFDASASSWKTILVGGLNAGGRGYYAMDITDPASPKGLWEFKWSNTCYDAGDTTTHGADCHIGYTFGKPIITKLTNGTWVVLVTSGHNNINTPNQAGDGQGYLYVLNAFSGKIMYKISTGEGDASTPSGLVHLNNFVDNAAINNTTLRVYGGDLLGNIWRFDINDTIAPSGREATLLGVAKDSNGNRQPITTRPELAELDHSPMVFVATGKLLGASDLADTQGQSVYGFVDPLTSASPAYADLRGALKPRAMTQHGSAPLATRTVDCPSTATAAACSATAGWVLDLPDPGERVNVDMKLYQGTLVIGSNVPESTACTSGGHSWLTNLNFGTGMAVNISGSPSATGLTASQYVSNSLIVGLSVVRLPSGLARTELSTSGGGAGTTATSLTGGQGGGPGGGSGLSCTGGGGGTAACDTLNAAESAPGRRISWRELTQ